MVPDTYHACLRQSCVFWGLKCLQRGALGQGVLDPGPRVESIHQLSVLDEKHKKAPGFYLKIPHNH